MSRRPPSARCRGSPASDAEAKRTDGGDGSQGRAGLPRGWRGARCAARAAAGRSRLRGRRRQRRADAGSWFQAGGPRLPGVPASWQRRGIRAGAHRAQVRARAHRLRGARRSVGDAGSRPAPPRFHHQRDRPRRGWPAGGSVRRRWRHRQPRAAACRRGLRRGPPAGAARGAFHGAFRPAGVHHRRGHAGADAADGGQWRTGRAGAGTGLAGAGEGAALRGAVGLPAGPAGRRCAARGVAGGRCAVRRAATRRFPPRGRYRRACRAGVRHGRAAGPGRRPDRLRRAGPRPRQGTDPRRGTAQARDARAARGPAGDRPQRAPEGARRTPRAGGDGRARAPQRAPHRRAQAGHRARADRALRRLPQARAHRPAGDRLRSGQARPRRTVLGAVSRRRPAPPPACRGAGGACARRGKRGVRPGGGRGAAQGADRGHCRGEIRARGRTGAAHRAAG